MRKKKSLASNLSLSITYNPSNFMSIRNQDNQRFIYTCLQKYKATTSETTEIMIELLKIDSNNDNYTR